MPDTIMESVLNGKLSIDILIKWLKNDVSEENSEDYTLFCCNRREFVSYFLSYLRSQTDNILQTNTNALQVLQHQNTPEKLFTSQRNHRRSISEPNTNDDGTPSNTLSVTKPTKCQESPSKDKPHKSKRVKTKLFVESEPIHKSRSHENSLNRSASSTRTDSDESRLSIGVERLVSSTPLKNGFRSEYPGLPITSPVTPQEPRHISRHNSYSHIRDEKYERCDTPRVNYKRNSGHDKSISLADYIVNAQPSKSKKKRNKNVSNESPDSELSNSKRLSSSLRLEKDKRRIKPTNLDGSSKSFSLNSFNTEAFQATSPLSLQDNIAFRRLNFEPEEKSSGLDTERTMLKHEISSIVEKFKVMSTNTKQTPQIKLVRKESIDNYIHADAAKLTNKKELDYLVIIYEYIINNNFILSLSSEIYYLICILLSKQYEDDYMNVEKCMQEEKYKIDYMLRTIHNCTYFAVKSLWRQKCVLELMLDKSSLKLLGENRRVRSFCPDLAKYLLNLYGIKCEADSYSKEVDRYSNGIICFNFETDNADNFPSVKSFHSFKKQRDLFYEMLRCWSEPDKQSTSIRTSLRSQVKSLLSLAVSSANHAHLARLMRDHMLAECAANVKESKLTKLQRRLIGPAATTAVDAHRLPKFSSREQFYKNLIIFAESESFRAHFRDALCHELVALDATATLSGLRSNEQSSNEIGKEYLILLKKLRLLAKLLGFLISLPYTQPPLGGDQDVVNFSVPKEKVLESDIAVRNYSQPPIDLKSILGSAIANRRLTITLPWLAQYLAMMDYTTLRIKYYKDIICTVFTLYNGLLKTNEPMSPKESMQYNTVVFLKLSLGWLFEMPHFPQDFFYDSSKSAQDFKAKPIEEQCVDFMNLIEESVLVEVCPHLKDFNVLLLTSFPSAEKEMGTFRHITPVTMSLNACDRIKNKEKEIQARLEEELLKSQPSSTRRVLEMVTDRVTSATVKELTAGVLVQARARARIEAANATRLWRLTDNNESALLSSLQCIYEAELRSLHIKAMEAAKLSVTSRAGMALQALLAGGSVKAPLEAVAKRSSLARIQKWIGDNWGTIAVFSKDIKSEMKNLLVLGDSLLAPSPVKPALSDSEVGCQHVSPSTTIVMIKEHICQLLEYETTGDVQPLLRQARQCCLPNNIFRQDSTTDALMQLSTELCIVYISRKPEGVTSAFFDKLHGLWNECCPDRRTKEIGDPVDESIGRDLGDTELRAPTPPSSDDEGDIKKPNIVIVPAKPSQEKLQPPEDSETCMLGHFDRTLCPRNIMLLASGRGEQRVVWGKMAELLVFLMKHDYLSEDSLSEQCLAVYRQDWSQNILENLSHCMKAVSEKWGRSSDGKFTLFLDFLSEYCDDMDYEQDLSVMS